MKLILAVLFIVLLILGILSAVGAINAETFQVLRDSCSRLISAG